MQGDLAQLGERHPYKVDVTGSSPVASTIKRFWKISEVAKRS